MGPVWAYWAFPMERYCNDIGSHIRNRRHPYSNINQYVASVAHLTQIEILYNLTDELSLEPPVSRDKDFVHPTCMFLRFYIYIYIWIFPNCYTLDPTYALLPPVKYSVTLSSSLWETVTATLSTRLNKRVSDIRKVLPRQTLFVQYGRACQLNGGDRMQARELVPLQSDSRDMSFVRVWSFSSNKFYLIYLPSTS